MKTTILDTTKINRILRRIAYQCVEACYDEEMILIVGVKPRGVWVAEQIANHLKDLSSIKHTIVAMEADDDQVLREHAETIKNGCVLLVDDIINSGLTMMQAAALVTAHEPRRLITACLVDRKHRRYPIHSDFTGLSLATTIQEHLSLIIEQEPIIVLE